MSYVFFQICLTASIAFTGREMLLLFSGIFTTIYLLVAHGVILYGQMLFEISTNILLISIFLSILPQFSMYLWKINQKKEFKYPIAKLGIRLSFIHAYFFTVLLVRNNLILGLSIIALTSVSFILIREMSSQNLKKHGRNHTNKNQNVFRVLSHNLSKSRINLGFLSPGNLIEDTSASQEDFCEVCCGCCACIICCGTCGMCDAMDDYPVDGGFQ